MQQHQVTDDELYPRDYRLEDYKVICKWLTDRKMASPEQHLLPNTGCVIDHVCCGFLYLTNSSVGMLEWYVTNPRSSPEKRSKGLRLLTDYLIRMAQQRDMKMLIANTKIEGIAWLAKQNDFVYTGKYLTFYRGI